MEENLRLSTFNDGIMSGLSIVIARLKRFEKDISAMKKTQDDYEPGDTHFMMYEAGYNEATDVITDMIDVIIGEIEDKLRICSGVDE